MLKGTIAAVEDLANLRQYKKPVNPGNDMYCVQIQAARTMAYCSIDFESTGFTLQTVVAHYNASAVTTSIWPLPTHAKQPSGKTCLVRATTGHLTT